MLPLLPGETIVVTGGALSASGDLNVFLVFAAGAVGAFLGDSACYWIGRKLGTRAAEKFLRGERGERSLQGGEKFLRGERGKRSLQWGREALERRGKTLIAVARFVPGGRTAASLVAGTTEFPWRTWMLADLAGVLFWSAYTTRPGRIGGAAFENQSWKGLLLAFGLAALTAAVLGAGAG